MALVYPQKYDSELRQELENIEHKPYRESLYVKFTVETLQKPLIVTRLKVDQMIYVPLLVNIEDPFTGGDSPRLNCGIPGSREVRDQNGNLVSIIDKAADIFSITLTSLQGPYIITTQLAQVYSGVTIGSPAKQATDVLLSLSFSNGDRPTSGRGFCVFEIVNLNRIPGYR